MVEKSWSWDWQHCRVGRVPSAVLHTRLSFSILVGQLPI